MGDTRAAAVKALDAGHARTVHAVAASLEEAEEALRAGVAEARAGGTSWADIGAALSTTADAAQRRFGEVDR